MSFLAGVAVTLVLQFGYGRIGTWFHFRYPDYIVMDDNRGVFGLVQSVKLRRTFDPYAAIRLAGDIGWTIVKGQMLYGLTLKEIEKQLEMAGISGYVDRQGAHYLPSARSDIDPWTIGHLVDGSCPAGKTANVD